MQSPEVLLCSVRPSEFGISGEIELVPATDSRQRVVQRGVFEIF